MAGGAAMIAAVIALGLGDGKPEPLPESQAFVAPTSTPEPTVPAPTPTPRPSDAPIERLTIARVGIDAPVIILGVDRDGAMQSPSKPMDVAWYDFSGRPGFGSNAVFAGHVDYRNFGPAVFWRLRELRQDDEILVRLTDGTEYRYRVISSNSYSSETAPVQDIVGPTDRDIVTLITCEGTFNTRTREYDKRLVVRAERIVETAAR